MIRHSQMSLRSESMRQADQTDDFRSESIAPFWPFASHFRSAPINGHRQTGLAGPVRAKPGSRHDATSGFKLVERSVLLV
jgi:hypothetical protein